MRSLVILSDKDITKLTKDELVAIRGKGNNDGEEHIIVIMSEKAHMEYMKERAGFGSVQLKQ